MRFLYRTYFDNKSNLHAFKIETIIELDQNPHMPFVRYETTADALAPPDSVEVTTIS